MMIAGAGLFLGLGIILGMKLGKAIGAAQLAEPPMITMLPCEECAKRRAAEAQAATSPADVDAMVKRQQAVEAAADGA